MNKPKKMNAISPTRDEDYSGWYQEVVKAADMAEHSPVRGCMVIKPWGYALWENIKTVMDKKFKELGHENAYFPLFIPLSYFQKEASHVEGFATECAVVTHHRLKKNAKGELEVDSPLEEPLIVRPTSEMIIGEMFSKWIQSYRDLPIKINQWANVVRWEMRTRFFLRTTEFLWQEGHTAHETKEEASEHAHLMLNVYVNVCKEYLALPSIPGRKTENERFPGAVDTLTFEMMMQDRKALQSGTSHFLGQNFSKASQIKYKSREGIDEYAWTTSWGSTTRLIGALLMVHSDDDGFIVPPRIAHQHVVIIPVLQKEETKEAVLAFAKEVKERLKKVPYHGGFIEPHLDTRELTSSEKQWQWIKKGVPLRIEIGPKEVEKNEVCLAVRTKGHKDKLFFSVDELTHKLPQILDDMHHFLYQRASSFLKEHTKELTTRAEFEQFFTPKDAEKPEIHGGFAKVYYAGDSNLEKEIKEKLNVTIRCIPFDQPKHEGLCIFTGKKTHQHVIFAKSY